MRIIDTGVLAALMASFVCSACVIDNSGPLGSDDDDVADDDDSAAAEDDDAVVEDEVCPGSYVRYTDIYYRDVDGNGCLSRSERDDPDSDQWVGVAVCGDGTFSTTWSEGDVEPGLPAYPFLNSNDPSTWCSEEDGDDDVAGDDDSDADDDDASGDDDVVTDDDDATPADDDASDDDDISDDGPATGPTACPPFGEWGVVWVRWWADADGDGCLDSTESDDSSSDLWVDVGVCPDGADHPYSYWDMSQWVYDLPPSPPFLAGNGGNACP